MTRLGWWMRIVGSFYLLQFVANAIVLAPIRAFGPAGALDEASAGVPIARFLVDTWVTFGLEVGGIGAALLVFSRAPDQARALVWTVIGIEVTRGIIADVYMISRGITFAGLLVWIVIHTVIIVTGVLTLRAAKAAGAVSSAPA